MKVETQNYTFTAPTNMATAPARDATEVTPPADTLAVSREIVSRKNSNDAVNTNNSAPSQKKLDDLARKLIGNDSALVIEKDPEGSGYIYKSINRITGEITKVWPKEEIVSQLSALNDGDARGLMIDASA